tara:strand:- start:1189 stop:1395 length:207 start_codon:yes stop_codon:yes gene_type:complete
MEYLESKYPKLRNIAIRTHTFDLSELEYFFKKYYQTSWDRVTLELESQFKMRMSESSRRLNRFLGFNV